MKESVEPTPPVTSEAVKSDKQPYETPILTEHGHAKNITLQTFFGTFSPPAD